jgi:two-component system, NtrC family, response regulator AtoC
MSATILIIDDEENFRYNTGLYLKSRGYEVIEAPTLAEGKECVRQSNADIILLDVTLPDGYGPDLLEQTVYIPNRPPVIVITANGDIEMAVEAMRSGAHDFLQKPIQFIQLEKSIQRAQEIVAMRRELAHLRQAQYKDMDFIVGKSAAMQRAMQRAERAASTSVSILITGKTGTGKDVMARAIHNMGPRADKPFIAINCAAIQNTMLEAELFGYEAGAFTGADKRKPGLMEIADGGILFLDEISSMSVETQAKLLRVLEEHAFRRVGGTALIKVDLQILAASNRDLPRYIEEGKFRDDLYYRLKLVDLHLPPLKDRMEDIPELVGQFIRKNNPVMGLNILDVTPRAMEAMMAYTWPGNIRELRNVIYNAMLFCDEGTIDLANLPVEITHIPL